MFDFEPIEILQEQHAKQLHALQTKGLGFDHAKLQRFAQATHDLIERETHKKYDEKLGKWVRTRKPRQKRLRDGQVVEIWVTHTDTADDLCLRFEGELYNQNEGPYPGTDTHPHCRCTRQIVAIPNEKGSLKWAVRKPKNRNRPKTKIPPKYRRGINPYDVDSGRTQDAVYA